MTDLIEAAMPQGGRGISRRDALKSVGVILAASALVVLAEEQLLSPSATQADLLSTLQRSTFARFLGDTFRLQAGASDRVALQLMQVRDLPAAVYLSASHLTEAYREACFSIVFRSPAGQALTQGSYQLAHSRIGDFMLFLVPMAVEADGQYYEAIFNRLVD